MRIRQVLAQATARLQEQGIRSARLEAELLLVQALKSDRLHLYLSLDNPVEAEQINLFTNLLSRRLNLEPLAYILGNKEFWGLEFAVGPGVMVPRPETEILLETVLQKLKKRIHDSLIIIDVGTGCGTLAVALALEMPNSLIFATDISSTALQFAQRNVLRHNVTERIRFFQADLFPPIEEPADIIISNPPYVAENEWDSLAPDIRDYEPRQALLAGQDGLKVIRRLISGSPSHLKKDGYLLFEHSPEQLDLIKSLLAQNGRFQPEFIKDWTGNFRAVYLQIRPHNNQR